MSETPKRRRAKGKPAKGDGEEATGERAETEVAGEASDADRAPAVGDENAKAAAVTTLDQWIGGAPVPRDLALVFGLVLPAMLLAANMWRVHPFTIDDSFISYRYARNLTKGLGLVYNAGERVEGYTNFLFTILLAGGIKLGIDPETLAKIIGAGSAFGGLGLTYAISGKLRPYGTLPCIATWLLASTIVFSGWSVFGLETGLFVALVLAGLYLFLRESGDHLAPSAEPAPGIPWSGAVFALAALTRPEAPLIVAVLMLFLGRRLVSRQNLLRGALFAVPVAAHYLFRHAYYGAWVPNTAAAKMGNFTAQLAAGVAYVTNYAQHAGPVLYLALLGAAVGVAGKRRDILAVTAVAVAWLAYVIVVGGDWMKFFRFMAPFEPLCFILIDVGVRRAVDKRDAATNLALALFAAFTIFWRAGTLREAQADFMQKEKPFWDAATGGVARWLLLNEPGEMAMGDIGYVGWATDYPILDLLGLVDPVISKLPGGYTQKLGKGFLDRFFGKESKYFLLISSSIDCKHPSVSGSQYVWADPRFLQQYKLGGTVPLDGGFAWCIYQRK